MIIYNSTKTGFLKDVDTGRIDEILLANLRRRTGRGASPAEVQSWHQSLTHMQVVLTDPEIPAEAGIGIEYQIPQTSKRIDFLLSGRDEEEKSDHVLIVELKQWTSASRTLMDGVVRTFIGGAERDVAHPSYQAWSYAELLKGFNESVYDSGVELHPCAYLHNFKTGGVLDHRFYRDIVAQAPVFLKGEVQNLRAFIKKWVRRGDQGKVIFQIEGGKIRPSKSLADSLASLVQGNREFTMVDDQKVVFERALYLARTASGERKRVLIVHGGPGTGKSVVAVNLLVAITKERQLTQYVTKNAAPRAVYEAMLTGVLTRTQYSNLFSGSGEFIHAEPGLFPVLIVDEAHRLNAKSGLYKNLGENQVKELIHAADVTVFFLDEDQRVTLRDIGTRSEILRWAEDYGAEVEELELRSQFRCNGSDGYLAWLDHVLQIRETAVDSLEALDFDYDFRVVDSPNELLDLIRKRNPERNRSRMVAGYCWRWKSKKDPRVYDVVIPEHDFRMRWNLASDGPLWMLKPDSIEEIGCIHTCQGLELDYVGVIIAEDLVVRDGEVITQPEKRDQYDSTIRGYKKMLREDPERARSEARAMILNTYRTLMSRALQGCYIYCVDDETQEYFREAVRPGGSTFEG